MRPYIGKKTQFIAGLCLGIFSLMAVLPINALANGFGGHIPMGGVGPHIGGGVGPHALGGPGVSHGFGAPHTFAGQHINNGFHPSVGHNGFHGSFNGNGAHGAIHGSFNGAHNQLHGSNARIGADNFRRDQFGSHGFNNGSRGFDHNGFNHGQDHGMNNGFDHNFGHNNFAHDQFGRNFDHEGFGHGQFSGQGHQFPGREYPLNGGISHNYDYAHPFNGNFHGDLHEGYLTHQDSVANGFGRDAYQYNLGQQGSYFRIGRP